MQHEARAGRVAEGVGRRCAHGFGRVKSIHGQTRSGTIRHANAGIAQLVEHDLAKVGVASSSLVSRSSSLSLGLPRFCFFQQAVILSIADAASSGQVAEWSCSGLQSRVRRFDPDPGLHCCCGDWMSGLRQSGFPPVNSITALSISTVWLAPWWRQATSRCGRPVHDSGRICRWQPGRNASSETGAHPRRVFVANRASAWTNGWIARSVHVARPPLQQ